MFVNLIINTLINSILEEGFIYGFALNLLIILKVLEFDKGKFIKLVAIGVPVSAILSNVLRLYISDINIVLSIMIAFTILILMKTQKVGFRHIFKILLAVFLSIVILQVTEIYILAYLKKTGETVETLKSSPFLSFYITVPERLMQYLLLGLVYAKRLDYIKVEFNEIQKRISICLLLGSVVYYCLFAQVILTDFIYINKFNLVGLTAGPIFVMWSYYCYIYFKNRKVLIRKKYTEILEKAHKYRIMKLKNEKEF